MIPRSLRSDGLSANTLKGLAVTVMLMDHTAWAFFPKESVMGLLWHIPGRIALPVLCFFIAEGYAHTCNVKRYALRLLAFALISYLPFLYFNTGQLPGPSTWYRWNILFSLLAGLLALWIQDTVSHPWMLYLITGCLFLFTLPGDWNGFPVMFILAFGLGRPSLRDGLHRYSLAAGLAVLAYSMPYILYLFTLTGTHLPFLFTSHLLPLSPSIWDFPLNAGIQAGLFLALPLLRCYNGHRYRSRTIQWAFYLFYPLHLLVLGWLRWAL